MQRKLFFLMTAVLVLSACSAENQALPPDAQRLVQPESFSQTVKEPIPVPESVPEVDNSWIIDTPENHGMNPEVFAQLHTALADSEVCAMVTAKDGVMVDEYYGDGYDESSLLALHSCSKSFTGALVGIAIEQGLIGGTDDLLSDYLPQMAALEDADKQKISLRHLLTNTSGLEWYEWGGGFSNWETFRSAANWVEYILGQRLIAQPGEVFNYSTGNTHLLAAALQQATGMSVWEYGKKNLFEPLGMESIDWGADAQGVTDGGNGILMTARDAARFGQLYLQGGIWNDRQIVPAGWLEESTTVQNAGPGGRTGEYGFQWWVRPFGAENYDTYYAFGAWGQYILVVPELKLVTVIASHYPQNSYAPLPYFTDYVLVA